MPVRSSRVCQRFAALLTALSAVTVPLATWAQSAEPPVWELQLRSNRHNDLGPVSELGDLKAGDLSRRGRRNIAYLDDELRVSRASGALTLSLLARSSGLIVATGDAVDAANHVEGVRSKESQQWSIVSVAPGPY